MRLLFVHLQQEARDRAREAVGLPERPDSQGG